MAEKDKGIKSLDDGTFTAFPNVKTIGIIMTTTGVLFTKAEANITKNINNPIDKRGAFTAILVIVRPIISIHPVRSKAALKINIAPTVITPGLLKTDKASSVLRTPVASKIAIADNATTSGGTNSFTNAKNTKTKRSKTIKIDIRVRKSIKAPIDLVIDSTGLKVYGEGEWKVRKHGWNKHRTWKKLHMGSDGMDLEIISVVLTGNEVDDAEAGIEIVAESKELIPIKSTAGDGAYDKKKFRGCIPIGVEQLIPPQKNAVLSKKRDPDLAQRDEAIKRIEQVGREEWKKEIGYHIRSNSEVNMFRYKKIFGGNMHARKGSYENAEMRINSKILNQFVDMGMPKSYKVAS